MVTSRSQSSLCVCCGFGGISVRTMFSNPGAQQSFELRTRKSRSVRERRSNCEVTERTSVGRFSDLLKPLSYSRTSACFSVIGEGRGGTESVQS